MNIDLSSAELVLADGYRRHGSLFGWIADPDKRFLAVFLTEVAKLFGHSMRMVEVGSFAGSTTRALIAFTGGHVIAIDNWKDFTGEGTRSLAGHPDGPSFFWHTLKYSGSDLSAQATLLSGDSKEIGKTWTTPIDLLFVDGDHSYDGASADLLLYTLHVVPGGFCLIDDYDMKDVKRAVDDRIGMAGWETIRIPDGDAAKIYVLRKPL